MIPSSALGLLAGMASALIWGTGDFVGGVAARRVSQFAVVALSAFAGLCFLIPTAVLTGEPFPSAATIGWSFAAGLCGAVGIAALYQGLATGASAVVAPTSAVVGAALPVVVGTVMQGLPGPADLAGIAFGLAGIWFVSNVGDATGSAARSGLSLGILAGLGFGAFFVLMAQVEGGVLFGALAFVKLAALAFGLVALVSRRRAFPSIRGNPLALLSGVLDTGGNLFFLLASRATSLAVAAVLASMYPAITVALSVVLLRERVRRSQVAGMVLCVAAVALIGAAP